MLHGILRRSSTFNTDSIDHLYRDQQDPEARLFLHYGDLTDGGSLRRILNRVQPDEVYNLGAQSRVKVSFEQPEFTADVVAATEHCGCSKPCGTTSANRDVRSRLYQAGSSEMFGSAKPPQNESTSFHPRSPYGASKVAAHWYCVNYREA